MRKQYSLFQSHLDLAHSYWERIVQPGDLVIDATCGNGRDTLKLCQLALPKGHVYALDIQKEALEAAKNYLLEYLSEIQFILGCHSVFPAEIKPLSVKLIVYNLGYLPGGNKTVTTQLDTTLESLRQAMSLVMPGGAISLTCYPGHAEGAKEEKAILDYVSTLSPQEWSVCHHRWINRHEAPSLLLLQRALQQVEKGSHIP